MEDKTQAAGGQDGEPERVEQPITDEQLEVAFVELSAGCPGRGGDLQGQAAADPRR